MNQSPQFGSHTLSATPWCLVWPLFTYSYVWRAKKLTPTTQAKKKQMVVKRDISVSMSLPLLFLPVVAGWRNSPFFKQRPAACLRQSTSQMEGPSVISASWSLIQT